MNQSSQDHRTLVEEIEELRRERDAVILAHNYQLPEVQDIADYVGDSLALSRKAACVDQKVIVFCGVHFMAESASILSPDKVVLLPARDAGCPMADMVDAESLREKKQELRDAAVVCYVNSSAEVKAESDICCTSSNAVKVVSLLPQRRIIFVPDKNLGSYVASKLMDKEIICWEGFCATHHGLLASDVDAAKRAHPDAVVAVHPECRPEVVGRADFVGSTSEIISFVKGSQHRKVIIGTEMGVLHKLKADNPDKTLFLLSPRLVCPNMKKTTLALVRDALRSMSPQVSVASDVRAKAARALERMIQIG